MKILHLADVHLDRPFSGIPREARARRRAQLHDSFRRCLALAEERDVDLVTVGGDLWERPQPDRDSVNSVVYDLGELGRPVLIACGNHDPFIPGCAYALADWPENVRLVRTSEPELHEFSDTVVWGVSWTGGDLSSDFLKSFRVPEDGRTHLLLLHGTSGPLAYLAEEVACTFQADQVRAAGFARCLAGHIHMASDDGTIVYPGSPEPIRWSESGRHCVALATVTAGTVAVELIDVNKFRVEKREIDCSGCLSSAELEDRVASNLGEGDAASVYLRLSLVGEVGADCMIDTQRIAHLHSRFAAVAVEDLTAPLLDIGGRSERRGLDGLFVRRLLERLDAATDDSERRMLELALEAGLRAIDGREAILYVD
jgi:DNA repair protein SbcD/Mre11